jgi:NitT/TauT family transport system substrate-binding protein
MEGMIQGDYPIAVGHKLSTLLLRFRLVLLAFDGKSRGGRGIAVLTHSNYELFESNNLTLVTVPGSSAEHRLKQFVKDMGVSRVEVSYCAMSDGMHLITKQSVIAGCMWEPFPTLMQHLGIGRVIWEESQGQDYLTGLVTSQEWMTNHSSFVYAYLKAHLRAHELIRKSPERMAKVLSEALDLPPKVIYRILTQTRWDAGIYYRDLQTLSKIGHSMFHEMDIEGMVTMDYLADAAHDMGLPDPRSAYLDDWIPDEVY